MTSTEPKVGYLPEINSHTDIEYPIPLWAVLPVALALAIVVRLIIKGVSAKR